MSKRPPSPLNDDANPEWTAADIASAKRIDELSPALQAKLRPLGRPKAAVVKARLTIRLDAVALARWRASGPGWQTRAAEVLARNAPD